MTFQLLNLRAYYLRIASCAIVLLLLVLVQSICAAELEDTRVSIHNDSLRISLDTESGDVVAWEVKEPAGVWQDFDYRDLADPGARLITLGGTLKGVRVADWVRSAGVWRVEHHTASSVELVLAPADANFVVRKTWTLSESSPWPTPSITVTAPIE